MPTWLIIILVVAAIGGVIGFFSGEDGNRGESAAQGAMMGAVGCGHVLFELLLWGLGIGILIWLFGAIFG